VQKAIKVRPGGVRLRVRARIWREETKRFMVEIDAGMEKANAIDAAGGPGPYARQA
jgi:hypothetical protein